MRRWAQSSPFLCLGFGVLRSRGADSRLTLVSAGLGEALAMVWVVACSASTPQNLTIATRPNQQDTATVGAKTRLKATIYNYDT